MYGALLDWLPAVAEIICRSAVYEDTTKQTSFAGHEMLHIELVKLYASILTFLGEATRYYKKNTLGMQNHDREFERD